MSWKCPRIVLGNVFWGAFGMFPEDVWDFGMVFQMLWNCPADILEMSQECAGDILALFVQRV